VGKARLREPKHIKGFPNDLAAPKKSFSSKEIKTIRPLTDRQKLAFTGWKDGKNLILHGSAGTGKTMLAMYFALSAVLNIKEPQYDTVKIIRSAVPVRNLGYLPGTEAEKTEVYEAPYREICRQLFDAPTAYETLKRAGKIEFVPTSFIRGLNMDNSIVVVEEMQNMSIHELDSIITRVGNDTMLIFSGDTNQSDFDGKFDKNGFKKFLTVLEKTGDFCMVEFGLEDVVRSGIVKRYLIAKHELS